MSKSKLFIFAGPNGSGKTSLVKKILAKGLPMGIILNADDIEKKLKEQKHLNLSDFSIYPHEKDWNDLLRDSTLIKKCLAEGIPFQLVLSNNVIVPSEMINSYDAACLSEFIRMELLKDGIDFNFETVMSHPSKLDFVKEAKRLGYYIELHFVSTESSKINEDRVAARILKGGHAVSREKIAERYLRSMELLADMIRHTDRCFLYDNSALEMITVIELVNGKPIEAISTERYDTLPIWVKKYVPSITEPEISD